MADSDSQHSDILNEDPNLEDDAPQSEFFDPRFQPGEEDEEYLQLLIQKETNFNFNIPSFPNNGIKSARLHAISWIFQGQEASNLCVRTSYTAVVYFDRFLSINPLDIEKPWQWRILSVACLFIAAKVEETEVPKLRDFRLYQDYEFRTEDIRRMELLVLQTLEWRMISLTPYPFLDRFLNQLSNNVHQFEVFKSVGYILALIKEISLVAYRPSVIAAAATIFTLNPGFTREQVEARVNNICSAAAVIELEQVFDCYNLIKRMEKDYNEASTSSGTKRKSSDM